MTFHVYFIWKTAFVNYTSACIYRYTYIRINLKFSDESNGGRKNKRNSYFVVIKIFDDIKHEILIAKERFEKREFRGWRWKKIDRFPAELIAARIIWNIPSLDLIHFLKGLQIDRFSLEFFIIFISILPPVRFRIFTILS